MPSKASRAAETLRKKTSAVVIFKYNFHRLASVIFDVFLLAPEDCSYIQCNGHYLSGFAGCTCRKTSVKFCYWAYDTMIPRYHEL